MEGTKTADTSFPAANDAVHLMHDESDHDSAMSFSEDLPTPRGTSCLERQAADEADPDVNNDALSDSDDDEAHDNNSDDADKHPDATYAVG